MKRIISVIFVFCLLALGYTTEQMDTLVSNIDWHWVFSDKLSREYISYTDARYREKYMISIPFFYERDYYNRKPTFRIYIRAECQQSDKFTDYRISGFH